MDPFTNSTLGATRDVVDFTILAGKAAARIAKFMGKDLELPKDLRAIQQKLSLVLAAAERIKTYIESHPDRVDDHIRACAQQLHEVQGRCRDLNALLDRYLPEKDASVAVKARAGLQSLAKDRKLAELAAKIKDDVSDLTLFQAVLSLDARDEGTGRGLEHLDGRIFHNYPNRRVSHFVGQAEQLRLVQSALETDVDSAGLLQACVVVGMGGQGKTQLALEYCRLSRKANKYRAIFWIDASSDRSAQQGYLQIAELLKSENQAFEDAALQCEYATATLSTWTVPWLLIFDNYDNPAVDIKRFMPPATTGRALVTSRSSMASRLGRTINLEGMSPTDSINLLFSASDAPRNGLDEVHAAEVVKRLGYLPLAIDQAGAYIQSNSLTVTLKTFLPYYEIRKREILSSTPAIWEYIRESDSQQSIESVFTTWNMSLDVLEPGTEDGQRKIAVLEVMSYLDEADISEELFRCYLHNVDGAELEEHPFPRNLLDPEGKWSHGIFSSLIDTFQDLALVSAASVEDETGDIHCSLHPLVKDWIRLRQPNNRQTANAELSAKVVAHAIMGNFWCLTGDGRIHELDICGDAIKFEMTHQFQAAMSGHIRSWRQSTEGLDKAPTFQGMLSRYPKDGDEVSAEAIFALFYGSLHDYTNEETLEILRAISHRVGPECNRAKLTRSISGMIWIQCTEYDESEWEGLTWRIWASDAATCTTGHAAESLCVFVRMHLSRGKGHTLHTAEYNLRAVLQAQSVKWENRRLEAAVRVTLAEALCARCSDVDSLNEALSIIAPILGIQAGGWTAADRMTALDWHLFASLVLLSRRVYTFEMRHMLLREAIGALAVPPEASGQALKPILRHLTSLGLDGESLEELKQIATCCVDAVHAGSLHKMHLSSAKRGLAIAHRGEGDHFKACERYRQALADNRKYGGSVMEYCVLLEEYAQCLQEVDVEEQSILAFKASISAAESLGQDTTWTRLEFSNALMRSGDKSKRLECLDLSRSLLEGFRRAARRDGSDEDIDDYLWSVQGEISGFEVLVGYLISMSDAFTLRADDRRQLDWALGTFEQKRSLPEPKARDCIGAVCILGTWIQDDDDLSLFCVDWALGQATNRFGADDKLIVEIRQTRESLLLQRINKGSRFDLISQRPLMLLRESY